MRKRLSNKTIYSGTFLRILNYFKMGKPFGVVSAYRTERTPEENQVRQQELKDLIRQEGLGFIPGAGNWGGVPEQSVFIPNASKEVMQELAAAFQQEAYIWGAKGHWAGYDTTTGAVLFEGNDIHMLGQEEPSEYSTFKRKKFRLQSRDPQSSKVVTMEPPEWLKKKKHRIVRKGTDIQFTDRYDALGIDRPDPATVCTGHCEGTGYVPVCPPPDWYKAHPERSYLAPVDETAPILRALWKEAEAEEPADDGWHFVVCPDCNGSGKIAKKNFRSRSNIGA